MFQIAESANSFLEELNGKVVTCPHFSSMILLKYIFKQQNVAIAFLFEDEHGT